MNWAIYETDYGIRVSRRDEAGESEAWYGQSGAFRGRESDPSLVTTR